MFIKRVKYYATDQIYVKIISKEIRTKPSGLKPYKISSRLLIFGSESYVNTYKPNFKVNIFHRSVIYIYSFWTAREGALHAFVAVRTQSIGVRSGNIEKTPVCT